MALTTLTNNEAVASFVSTATTTTKNYSQSLAAGTLVVFGYQNSTTNTSTVSATDSAGNSYAVQSVVGVSGTRGTTALLYCRLTFPVTTATTITFTATGAQKAVYTSFAIRATGTLAYNNTTTTTTLSTATSTTSWTTPSLTVSSANASGLVIGVFGFINDYNFGTLPSTSASPDVFIRFYDGGTAGGASIGLAYEPVTSAASYSVRMTSTSGSADFIGMTAHFTDTPIRTINSVIEMF